MSSNTFSGRPPGLAGVCSISGVIALIRTAFATRVRAVPADVPRHLASAGGVPDVNRVFQIERLDERGQIVGVGVHVVAGPRLARPAVAPAIVRDAPKATRRRGRASGPPTHRN